jgi:iron complex outermembrane receptor protein
MSRHTFRALALCTVASFSAIQARAQNVPADNSNTVSEIADIVVTAQRRQETAQHTALAITAISGDQLAQQGVQDVTNLTSRMPNVQVAADTSGETLLAIRGIGSTDLNEEGDTSVAFNLDGVFISRNSSMSGLFYDINRIEVLRGPQGTLYGRSATAGAINVISNQPTFKFEGAGSVEVGNYATLGSQGMINVPLSDTIAMRAAFSTRRHDGFADNGNNLHTKDQDDIAGRYQILAKPTERLTIHLGADFFHAGGAGGGFRTFEQIVPFANPNDPYKYPLKGPHRRDQTDWGLRGQVDYDLGFGTLTYLGAYRATDANIYADWSILAGLPLATYQKNKQHEVVHEVRLAGKVGDLSYVVGGNLFNEYSNVTLDIDLSPLGSPTNLEFFKPRANASSKGVFGQVTYAVTPKFRLTAGVRYTKDRKYSFDGETRSVDPVTGIKTTNVTQNVDTHFTKTTWRLGADYDVGPNSLLYASAATGYKPGGYFDGSAPNTFQPESITAYEIGSKNRFLGNTLQLNLTGFYYDYRNFQVAATRQVAGGVAGITMNAQKAQVYGLEAESVFRFTPNDQIDLSVSYLHTQYKKFYLPAGDAFTNFGQPAGAPLVPLDLSDHRLARSPKFTINAGYQHSFELPGGGKITPSVFTHIESSQNLEYHGYAITRKPSFSHTEVTIGYEAPERKWYVNAYIRNLENRGLPVLVNLNILTNNPTQAAGAIEAPRTFGAIFGAKF